MVIGVLTFLFFLSMAGTIFGTDMTKELKDFLFRKGVVVDVRMEQREVLIDLGRGKVYIGEVFNVFEEGEQIIHPMTGENLGRRKKNKGKIKIVDVQEMYSVGKIIEGREINIGDKVELTIKEACFSGSDETFFQLSSLLQGSIIKSDQCDYRFIELEEGIGIEFKGKPIGLFKKHREKRLITETSTQSLTINKAILKTELLLSINELPVSADLCRFGGVDSNFLLLLTESRIFIYEIVGKNLIKLVEKRLPAGDPVSVQCAQVDGYPKELIILNMFTGDEPRAYVYKLVGDSLVEVVKNYNRFIGNIEIEASKSHLIAQSFDSRNFWGEVVRIKIKGDKILEKEKLIFLMVFE
jgi:hypothetical protein